MDIIKKLVDRYVAPAIAALLGWGASLGIPMPEDTEQTILTAIAVIIAAIALPVIAWGKDRIQKLVGGLFSK